MEIEVENQLRSLLQLQILPFTVENRFRSLYRLQLLHFTAKEVYVDLDFHILMLRTSLEVYRRRQVQYSGDSEAVGYDIVVHSLPAGYDNEAVVIGNGHRCLPMRQQLLRELSVFLLV